jgi:molybdopterin-containing oxidoreductase family iron-sulfur binding subunit
LGGNFAQAWGKVGFKVSFSSYLDETAAGADLVLPDLHPLEQWNDSRPRAGVYALQQPAMLPVFDGTKQTGDVLLRAAGRTETFKSYLQGKWTALHRRLGGGKPFEQWWDEALQHGGVYGEPPTRAVRLAAGAGAATTETAQPYTAGAITAIVFPHPVLHDGRGANKPWLQELPDPV